MHLAIEHQALREVAADRPSACIRSHAAATPVIREISLLAATDGRRRVSGAVPPAAGAPSADQVVALAEFVDQPRNVRRIIFAVAVERHHDRAGGAIESAGQRGGLTGIARQPEHAHVRVALANTAQHLEAAVAAAVINEQDLLGAAQTAQHRVELAMERREVVPLVVKRNDY